MPAPPGAGLDSPAPVGATEVNSANESAADDGGERKCFVSEWKVVPSRMVDRSQFTPEQLIELEEFYEKVFGVEDKMIPFQDCVKVRTIYFDQEPGEEKERDGTRKNEGEARKAEEG